MKKEVVVDKNKRLYTREAFNSMTESGYALAANALAQHVAQEVDRSILRYCSTGTIVGLLKKANFKEHKHPTGGADIYYRHMRNNRFKVEVRIDRDREFFDVVLYEKGIVSPVHIGSISKNNWNEELSEINETWTKFMDERSKKKGG